MSTETKPNQPAHPQRPQRPQSAQELAHFWEADQAVRACEQEMADLSVELRRRRKHLQNVVKELKRNGIEAPDTGPNIGRPMLPLSSFP